MQGESVRCPTCQSEALQSDRCEERIVVGGETFVVDVVCERCVKCGEEVVSYQARSAAELTVAFALAQRGRLSGTTLRFMRKALGYQAGELATLIDVTPETFSRWENGERLPEGRAFVLVGLLVAARLRGSNDAVGLLEALRAPVQFAAAPVKLAG